MEITHQANDLKVVPDYTDSEIRELDAFIAERIFGFTMVRNLTEEYSQALVGIKDGRQMDVPPFSTSPAAAMEVLEKCFDKSGSGIVAGQTFGGFYCEVFPPTRELKNIKPHPTLELAICGCAKKLFA